MLALRLKSNFGAHLRIALVLCSLPIVAACDGSNPREAKLSVGSEDHYSIAAGMTLQREAPGVLANDPDAGPESVAQLAIPARYGTVELAEDGSFSYTPTYKFSGEDTFFYRIVDGDRVSDPVRVQITYPNVVVILVDDLGLGDLAVYNDRAITATPNLEALANSGMAFSRAHATAAVCSPSRYSVLTGNHPYRGRLASGVWNTYEPATMILPGQQTLGHLFAEAGYQTGFVGKVHNGSAFWDIDGNDYTKYHLDVDFTRPFDRGPTQFGFDYSFLLPGGVSSKQYAYYENDRLVRFNPSSGNYESFADNADAQDKFVYIDQGWGHLHNGGAIGAPGWAMDNYDNRQTGAALTHKALAFMDQAIADGTASAGPKPFFLYFAPAQLHTPNSPPDYFNLAHTNDAEPAQDGIPVAGASNFSPRHDRIIEVDLIVGAVVDFLDQRGQLNNTLIVFSSDNGPLRLPKEEANRPQGAERGVPLRGYKGEIHEGGHRVPLLARWGDGSKNRSAIKPGSRSTELLGLHDLAATFYALLGRQRAVGQANDSKSFLPVLLSEPTGAPVRDHLLIQGSPSSAADNQNYVDRAFYQRDPADNLWKLIVVSTNTDVLAELSWRELYNLTDDPGESRNLIDDTDSQAVLQVMKSDFLDLIVQPQTIVSYR